MAIRPRKKIFKDGTVEWTIPDGILVRGHTHRDEAPAIIWGGRGSDEGSTAWFSFGKARRPPSNGPFDLQSNGDGLWTNPNRPRATVLI